jgi:Caspase domain
MPRRVSRNLALGVLILVAVAGRPATCRAAIKIAALVIGNNRPPASGGNSAREGALLPLRFADDDAAAFDELIVELRGQARLLTVMDRETEASYPYLAPLARPPTLAELKGAVTDLAAEIQRNRARGDRTHLFIFFSGHGSFAEDGAPTLALLDGGITSHFLYDEVLERLPADEVHLLVDSCRAEAVVRPRDTEAQPVAVPPSESAAFLARTTLARFPRVGAIVAAASDAQAHEWDELQHGIFTYELLSALRGAADVNRDRRIEYSEVYAFLSAANRGISDPRARLHVVARPPDLDRHTPLVDLSRSPEAGTSRLADVPARAGMVDLEDGAGRRLASIRGELGYVADLVLPAGRTIFVRASGGEARFDARAGESVSFDSLRFLPPRSRTRGAMEEAVRRGLFAGEFGRGYYRGFIDQAAEFPPVSFEDGLVVGRSAPPVETARAGSGTKLVVGVGLSDAVAQNLEASRGFRVGLRPRERRGALVSVDLLRAAGPGIAEWRALGTAGWLSGIEAGPLRGWVGVAAGGGFVSQTADGASARWSGLLTAGPTVGAEIRLSRTVGAWVEGQAVGNVYRQESRMTTSLSPSLWTGLYVDL